MLKALGLLKKWLFLKKPNVEGANAKSVLIRQPWIKSPRSQRLKGGLYRIDAMGRKVYLKASGSQSKASHGAKWRRPKCTTEL